MRKVDKGSGVDVDIHPIFDLGRVESTFSLDIKIDKQT